MCLPGDSVLLSTLSSEVVIDSVGSQEVARVGAQRPLYPPPSHSDGDAHLTVVQHQTQEMDKATVLLNRLDHRSYSESIACIRLFACVCFYVILSHA